MFLGYQNELIDGSEVETLFVAFIAETKEELENIPCVSFAKIEETSDEYILKDGKYMLKSVAEAMQVEEDKQTRITELKQLLANTDYIIIKLAEDAASREEYAEQLEQRKAWRKEINELEEILNPVEEIKANNPYPDAIPVVEPIEKIEELPVVEEID